MLTHVYNRAATAQHRPSSGQSTMNALGAISNTAPRDSLSGFNTSLNSAAATGFVSALGMLELEQAMMYLSPDVKLLCGARMTVTGRQQVRRILLGVLASLNTLSYRPMVTWAKDGVTVIEADITIEWDDGTASCLPITMILRVKFDLIVDLHVCCYEPELPAHLTMPAWCHRPTAA